MAKQGGIGTKRKMATQDWETQDGLIMKTPFEMGPIRRIWLHHAEGQVGFWSDGVS